VYQGWEEVGMHAEIDLLWKQVEDAQLSTVSFSSDLVSLQPWAPLVVRAQLENRTTELLFLLFIVGPGCRLVWAPNGMYDLRYHSKLSKKRGRRLSTATSSGRKVGRPKASSKSTSKNKRKNKNNIAGAETKTESSTTKPEGVRSAKRQRKGVAATAAIAVVVEAVGAVEVVKTTARSGSETGNPSEIVLVPEIPLKSIADMALCQFYRDLLVIMIEEAQQNTPRRAPRTEKVGQQQQQPSQKNKKERRDDDDDDDDTIEEKKVSPKLIAQRRFVVKHLQPHFEKIMKSLHDMVRQLLVLCPNDTPLFLTKTPENAAAIELHRQNGKVPRKASSTTAFVCYNLVFVYLCLLRNGVVLDFDSTLPLWMGVAHKHFPSLSHKEDINVWTRGLRTLNERNIELKFNSLGIAKRMGKFLLTECFDQLDAKQCARAHTCFSFYIKYFETYQLFEKNGSCKVGKYSSFCFFSKRWLEPIFMGFHMMKLNEEAWRGDHFPFIGLMDQFINQGPHNLQQLSAAFEQKEHRNLVRRRHQFMDRVRKTDTGWTDQEVDTMHKTWKLPGGNPPCPPTTV